MLIAFGSLVGLSLNHQLVIDAFTGKLSAPSRVTDDVALEVVLPNPVMIDEVRPLQDAGALVVDARSPELYADGHLPGAVSLPMLEADDILSDFLQKVPRNQTLIIYCSGYGCPDSFDLGMQLLAEGYLDVRVFEGGYPEWRDAGLPVEPGAP